MNCNCFNSTTSYSVVTRCHLGTHVVFDLAKETSVNHFLVLHFIVVANVAPNEASRQFQSRQTRSPESTESLLSAIYVLIYWIYRRLDRM